MLKRLVIALAAVLGLGLTGVAPAAAAPNWEPYTQTRQWFCNPMPTELAPGLFGNACIISQTGSDLRAVVTMHNRFGPAKTIAAPDVRLQLDGNLSLPLACNNYQLLPTQARACFGPRATTSRCIQAWTVARVTVNGTSHRLQSPPFRCNP